MKTQQVIWSFIILFILSSCSINRFLDEGSKLYKGAELEFTNESKIQNQKRLEQDIQEAIFPAPNNRFLGFVYFRLWVYFKYKENHNKGIRKWLYNQFAEEPVYISDVDIPFVEKIIQKEMQDHGHFKSEVDGDVKEEENSAMVHYVIQPSKFTKINKVVRPNLEGELDSLIRSYNAFWVKKNNRYRLEDFSEERYNLAEYIRSHGYYSFNQQDIFYLVDTASLDKVDVYMRIRKPEKDSIFRKFYIRNIDVNTTYNGGTNSEDSTAERIQYKGLNIYEDYRFIDKKTLYSNVLIRPGDVFSVDDYNLTLNRLINLNIFRYVNIQYKKRGLDSLDVEIQLTPGLFKGVQYDFEVSTSDRSFLGSSLVGSFYNNNALLRAERTTVSLRGGTEFQYINGTPTLAILNANAEFKHEIPRLIVPFPVKRYRSSVSPKTILRVQENYQLWLRYFTMNSVNIDYTYEWKTDNRTTHAIQPAFLNLVNVFRTTEVFDSIITERPALGLSYQDNLLLGGRYNFTFNSRKSELERNHFTIKTTAETSGFLLGTASSLIGGLSPNIFGVPVSQYVLGEFEYKFTRDFTAKEKLVTRVSLGAVKPYGSTSIAPFTRRFFMGGPNSLRGFGFRSVGPGRYMNTDSTASNNPIDQAGDIKFLWNTEYRFPLYSVFKGAVFIDAGNVWLFEEEPNRNSGVFNWADFYKEIAVNTGFGVRLDVSYFAVRLDAGVPIYRPGENLGERWIYQFPEQGVWPWMKGNIVLSGGIGYPF